MGWFLVVVALAAVGVATGMVVRRGAATGPADPEPEAGDPRPARLNTELVSSGERITLLEMHALRRAGEAVVLLDARSDQSRADDPRRPRGAVRLPPEQAAQRAAELALPRHAWLLAYCT